MDSQQLLEQYAGGQRDFIRADLRGSVLKDADLKEADLRRADFRGADLQGANLQGANLQGADLRGAFLKDADLKEADLRRAYLCGANLQGADLRGAHLSDYYLPSRQELLDHLSSHAASEQYDQANWCGANCCLSGAAGDLINNQSLGVALIKVVIPEFNISVLYQPEEEVAIAELERVAALG